MYCPYCSEFIDGNELNWDDEQTDQTIPCPKCERQVIVIRRYTYDIVAVEPDSDELHIGPE